MTYDGFGRLKSKHVPEQAEGTGTSRVYNADDTVQSVIDARGASKAFSCRLSNSLQQCLRCMSAASWSSYLVNKIFLSLTFISCVALGVCSSSTPTNLQRVQTVTPAELPQANSNSPVSAQISQVGAEQTSFGAEEEMRQPVSIPRDVLKMLRHDERNQRVLRAGESESDILASWFVASEIKLNDDALPDLIVQSANPRLLGANLVRFWLFRKSPKGNELALRVDALRLEVLKAKSKGYRKIRTSKATANEVTISDYEFSGDRYKERSTSREPIKH